METPEISILNLMYSKLRHIFFLVTAGWLLSSCSTDAPDVGKIEQGSAVEFATSGVSRAVTTNINNAGSKFVIYGDKKLKADDSGNALNVVFNNTEVEYDGASWKYDGLQYWFPKHEHSFVAIHPATIGSGAEYANSRLSFVYTIPTSANNEVAKDDVADIIAATHRRFHDPDDNEVSNVVTLKFGHIQSLINFAAAFDDNYLNETEFIKLKKLELSGFKTKATFSILPASLFTNNQTDDRVNDVTGQEADGHMTIEFAEPVTVANNRAHVGLFDDNDAIIMLPQAFAADSDAHVTISYTINDDPTVKQVSLQLMNQKWESGKSYTYRFTINRRGLLPETTTITDWEVLPVGNIDAH